MAAFRDQHVSLERNHLDPTLLETGRLDGDDTLRRARLALAQTDDLARRMQRVANEHRLGHNQLVVTEVGHKGAERGVTDAEVALPLLLNSYRVLMSRGMKGCFVYCADRPTRDFLRRALSNAGGSVDESVGFG